MINLIVMAMVWMASSFCYYLINYQLKYLPGNINVNAILSYFAEMTSYAVQGYLMSKIMAKWTFFSLLVLSAVAGLFIVLLAGSNISDLAYASLVFGAKFGVAGVFGAVYIGHNRMFPILFAISSCGFCNIIARVASFCAPMVAEIDGSLPMIIFTAVCAIVATSSIFLQE